MKIAKLNAFWFAGCLALAAIGAQAQPQQPGQPGQQGQQGQQQPGPAPQPPPPRLPDVFPGLPTVPLQPLLDRVARDAKKQFLVDGHVSGDVYLGGTRADDLTFPLLLSVLRANGLAAVELEGRVNIVRDNDVRFYGTPIVQNDDKSIPADEWITRVITVTNIEAAQLVPILRPLLPQQAHLAAFPPSRLVVVDRYANVQRISAIVKSLDQPSAARPRE